MKTYFLPVGLILSLIIALVFPAPGIYLKELGIIPWCVFVIFFINGYQTKLSDIPKSPSFIYTLLLTTFLCLILSPFLGLLTANLLQLSIGLTLGILVQSAVPSTLSTCIVMTNLAKGKGSWALVMTVLINILGVFSIPFMLSLTAGDNIDFTIESLPLLHKLIVLLLIPFILGFIFKKMSFIPLPAGALGYLPSAMVIMAVWLSLSASSDILYLISAFSLLKIFIATLLVHFGLMFCAIVSANFLPIDAGAKIAVAFTASQKTLPVAVSILTSFDHNVGDAILFCVIFHFIQLFADSAILPKLQKYYKL